MASYTIRLYSPLRVECEMPYEPPWMLGDDYRLLTNAEKILCKEKITGAMLKCMPSGKSGFSYKYRVKLKIYFEKPNGSNVNVEQ